MAASIGGRFIFAGFRHRWLRLALGFIARERLSLDHLRRRPTSTLADNYKRKVDE